MKNLFKHARKKLHRVTSIILVLSLMFSNVSISSFAENVKTETSELAFEYTEDTDAMISIESEEVSEEDAESDVEISDEETSDDEELSEAAEAEEKEDEDAEEETESEMEIIEDDENSSDGEEETESVVEIIEDETTAEEVTEEETIADGEISEVVDEELGGVIGGGAAGAAGLNTESGASAEEQEEAAKPFIGRQKVGNVTVIVSANPGVFPNGATLEVTEVDDDQQEIIDAAIEEVRAGNV